MLFFALQAALIIYDRDYKPGSVIDSHLSRRTVAGTLKPPPGDGRADQCLLRGVAPNRVYSDGRFHAPSGELLPRLSTLTGCTTIAAAGGISLLHFS